MTKATLRLVAFGIVITGARTVLATPTPQQNCDYARIIAWKAYSACVDTVVARLAKGVGNATYAGFANCRHTYLRKWTGFQNPSRTPSLAGSTCVGPRFTDSGDQSVTDLFTGLTWEKKDNLDGSENFPDPHDADNSYTWSSGAPFKEDGAVFTDFLAKLNAGAGFAGANGWRLPTVTELQTILLDFRCSGAGFSPQCTCPSFPCVNGALDAADTQAAAYWAATSWVSTDYAWTVNDGAFVTQAPKATLNLYVRAVRGGL